MSFLKDIVRYKKRRLKELKKDMGDIRARALELASGKENVFRKALAKPEMSMIAEIKTASPSKGHLSGHTVEELADFYSRTAVDCVSVLTEDRYFKGSIENIGTVSRICGKPVLMKDFIISEYQIYEGVLKGASAVLLISAILSRSRLRKMLGICRKLNITGLVEVHSRKDLGKCRGLKDLEVIGVNSRNLRTLLMDREVTGDLVGDIDDRLIKVAESGIDSRKKIEELYGMGYDAVLVGESIVTAEDPGKKIRELLGEG
ncbi:MAG: indole-3-glycerol-phosphate synthase [Elusimicrobia bacterium]|nr:indole-3-glycerol-phosphate synthase [Elusimicrobiota bacterium]